MTNQIFKKIETLLNTLFQLCLGFPKKTREFTTPFRENLKNLPPWFVRIYQHSIFFFRNKIWPILFKTVIIAFLLIFVILIISLTKVGLATGLSNEYQELFGVLTSTIGTMVAIFFSLILLPLNQIAAKYSPKFLKYIKKDWVFISIFFASVFILIYDVVFLFLGATFLIAISAIILFVFLICLLGLFVSHVIKLLNAYNSILIPSHKEIVKKFRKMIPHSRKRCEKMVKKTLGKQSELKEQINICLFKVDENITNYIQESLLPIQEVAIKAIKEFDLEQAKNAIRTMMSVVVNYLQARKQYHTDDDPLLYFLYTEYKLLTQTASNELKVRLHPFIVDCWRMVGLYAAVVNVKGGKRLLGENLNFLVTYPVQGLKELCILNLPEMDSYAPGKACEALADIGVQLMKEGYDHQASSIVQELKGVSLYAERSGIKNVSGSANYAIMRIYAAGVFLRHLGSKDDLNYPYREINKSINGLLESFLQKKRSTFDNIILSPIIGPILDPFKGLNLSRISEYGLFNPELNKFAIEKNLESVSANIKSIKRGLELLARYEDWYFSNQALENLYRILLNLLSYINKEMAKVHILFYKEHPFLDKELIEQCSDVIVEGFATLIEMAKSRADKYLFENDHLHILFSYYLIILYEYKIRPSESLRNLFEKIHEALCNLIVEYKSLPNSDNNDDLYKYYRLLVVVLRENGFDALASNFDVPEFEYRPAGTFVSHESQFPKTMFDRQWIIKRPGFQVNAYYYNQIESALKLDTLEF